MLIQVIDFFHKVINGALLELAHADPSVTWLDQLAAHRLLFDLFANDGDGESAVLIFAKYSQYHFGGRFAAHTLDRFIEAQSLYRGVVDLDNQVVGLETRTVGR